MSAENTTVKKLDNVEEFNNIKSGFKTFSDVTSTEMKQGKKIIKIKPGLEKTDVDRYNNWFNKLNVKLKVKNYESILWVGTHRLKIEKFIEETYPKPTTASSYYNSLSNILLAIDKNKYKEYCRTLIVKSKARQRVAQAQTEEGLLSEDQLKNKYVSYTNISVQRDKWIKHWEGLRPVNKVVIPFKAKGKAKKPIVSDDLRTAIMYSLMLACNTYVPPLRVNIEDMKFHYGDKPPEEKSQQNYIWRKAKDHYAYVINYDKVENKKIAKDIPRSIFDLTVDIIDIHGRQITNGKKLCQLIEMSLEDFPRTYLLSNPTEDPEGIRPMTASSFRNGLANIFKPLKPTQNIIRKAYINLVYNSSLFRSLPVNALKSLGDLMRHDFITAMKTYRKVNAPDDVLPDFGPLSEAKIVRTINIPVMVEKKRKSMALIAKNYREKNQEKVLESRRTYYTNNKEAILKRKIINNLNSQAQTQVQKRTIAKYDLKQNPITGEWS